MEQAALFPMPAPRGPTEPIVRTADIEGIYRWTLHRAWGSGPCVLWCGTNPSTADGLKDDPTIRREVRFSFLWGFGSMVKVNFYPFRSPSMAELRGWLKGVNSNYPAREAWMRNLRVITDLIKCADLHIAVWGNEIDPEHLRFFYTVTDSGVFTPEVEAASYNDPGFVAPKVEWHCLGTNKDGSPRHSLARGKHRVPDTQRPVLWRAA